VREDKKKVIALPRSFKSRGARYSDIITAITTAIEAGRLRPGERLPTQRELAQQLGVAVGTVTRAYAELARLGVLSGTVGRGTFLKAIASSLSQAEKLEAPTNAVDLTISRPLIEPCERHLGRTLIALAQDRGLAATLSLQPSAGLLRHREAGAQWAGRVGLSVAPDQVVICSGGQHALAVACAAFTNPGDLVLTEELNYPGLRLLQKIFKLRLKPVRIDSDGLSPEAFDDACREEQPRFLICTPTIHNPTAAVMSPRRREKIAELAARYDVTIVENDMLGPMPCTPHQPLSALIPERSLYIAGTSKCLGNCVRIGYLVGPPDWAKAIAAAVQGTSWMASSLTAEIVTSWIQDGTAEQIIEWHRREIAARQKMAAEILAKHHFDTHPQAYHLWLHLPERWRADEFAQQAAQCRVGVLPSDAFAIGRAASSHAVRVSLGGFTTRSSLSDGLRQLAGLMADQPRVEQILT
jgi:DNA-binding transcriptional MocR family regulator